MFCRIAKLPCTSFFLQHWMPTPIKLKYATKIQIKWMWLVLPQYTLVFSIQRHVNAGTHSCRPQWCRSLWSSGNMPDCDRIQPWAIVTFSLWHGLHIVTPVPRSSQHYTLRRMVKWVSAFGPAISWTRACLKLTCWLHIRLKKMPRMGRIMRQQQRSWNK